MTLKARFLALAWQLRVAVMVIFAEALATAAVALFFIVGLLLDAKQLGAMIANRNLRRSWRHGGLSFFHRATISFSQTLG